MRNVLTCLVVVTACGIAGGCRQGPFQAPDLSGTGLQYYWTLAVDLDRGEAIDRLYLMDEQLYCLTDHRRLIALDAKRGLPNWSWEIPEKVEPIFNPCHPPAAVTMSVADPNTGKRADQTFRAMVLNTVSRLWVLNREKGEVVRELALPFAVNCAGATDGLYFYAGGVNGLYHAFDLDAGVHTWNAYTGAMITAALQYADEHVYVASEDHHVYASKVEGMVSHKVWTQRLDASVVADFHVGPRGCFVPSEDGKLYAFHAYSGEPLWVPFACRGPLTTPTQVGQAKVYQYADGDKFYAIDIVTGAEMWSSEAARTVLAIMEGNIYLRDRQGRLLIADTDTGKVTRAVPMSQLPLVVPNTTASAIYAATADGKLFCLRPVSAGRLPLEELMKR